jgi:hypothetical protein
MWIELTIPVPEGLARLCGYPGQARYVGLCWQPCGDEVEYDDGQTSGTGSWGPYLAYSQHLAAGPHLAPFDLGSSDSEPKHILIIDQQERTAVVADQRTGRDFLRRQPHPPLPDLDAVGMADSLLADFLDVGKWEEVKIDQAAIEARMRAEARQVDEMLRFLDGFLADREDRHETCGEG